MIGRKTKKACLLLLLFAGLLPTAAHAQLNCSAAITSPVQFGPVSPFSFGVYDASANLTVTCTGAPGGSLIAVCPGIGSGSGGINAASQRMLARSGGAETIPFQIFQNASRTATWGSPGNPGLGGTPLLTRAGPGVLTVPVFFRLYVGQTTTAPGRYASLFSGFDAAISYGSVATASGGCSGVAGFLNRTATASFTVQTQLQPGCLLDVIQHVDFGSVQTVIPTTDAAGRLSVQCTRGTGYKISLSAGNGSGATTAVRRMTGPGGGAIGYSLYQNPGRTQLWGNNVGIDTQSGTGTGSANPVSVYGRIPSQTAPAPGVYRDTVIVTLSY